LLETTNASIDEIAAATGFETATTYRHHFGRALQTSPSAYRRAFQVRGIQVQGIQVRAVQNTDR
jgi:AraC family transcriptional activator FtrA